MATTYMARMIFAAAATTQILYVIGTNSTENFANFKKEFPAYETRINTFVGDIGKVYATMKIGNAAFMSTLAKYQDRLPKNETKLEVVRFRETCYCKGRYWVPCPERCLDSCYDWLESNAIDNCTALTGQSFGCYCDDTKSQSCNVDQSQGGWVSVELCYQNKTIQVPVDQPCKEFVLDQSLVDWSYTQFYELLMEPLKKLVRRCQFQLALLKQSIVDTDDQYNITIKKCAEQGEPLCPEAPQLLDDKLIYFKQLQKNISLTTFDTRDAVERGSENVFVLREKTLAQINLTIQNYACCMKALNFTVPDIDCNSFTPEPTTTISPFTFGNQLLFSELNKPLPKYVPK